MCPERSQAQDLALSSRSHGSLEVNSRARVFVRVCVYRIVHKKERGRGGMPVREDSKRGPRPLCERGMRT